MCKRKHHGAGEMGHQAGGNMCWWSFFTSPWTQAEITERSHPNTFQNPVNHWRPTPNSVPNTWAFLEDSSYLNHNRWDSIMTSSWMQAISCPENVTVLVYCCTKQAYQGSGVFLCVFYWIVMKNRVTRVAALVWMLCHKRRICGNWHPHTPWGCGNWYNPCGKQFGMSIENHPNTHIPWLTSLLGVYPKKIIVKKVIHEGVMGALFSKDENQQMYKPQVGKIFQ